MTKTTKPPPPEKPRPVSLPNAGVDSDFQAAYLVQVHDSVVGIDTEKRINYWGAGAERIYGYTAEEAMGRSIDMLRPDDAQELWSPLRAEGRLNIVAQRLRKNGELFTCHILLTLQRDDQGRIIGGIGYNLDISEQVKIMKALRRQALLTEQTRDAVMSSDLEGFIETWNGAAEEILGWTAEEAIGQHVTIMLPGLTQEAWAKSFNLDFVEQDKPLIKEEKRVRKSGQEFDAELTISALFEEGKAIGLMGSLRDITKRKQAEQALIKSERRHRVLFETSPDAIALVNLDGSVIARNKAYEHLLGYTAQQLQVMNYAEFTPEKCLETDNARRQTLIQTGEAQDYEKELIHQDGTIIPIQLKMWLVKDSDQEPAYVISRCQDITRQKAMAEQEQQSRKMQAIGTLASGIAHDFNNILGIIVSNAEIAMRGSNLSDQTQFNLREILEAGERAATLTSQILSFSRREETEDRRTDISVALGGAFKLLQSTIPSTIQLNADIADHCGIVNASASNIQQILLNLGANAAQSMEEKTGVIDIRLRLERLDQPGPGGTCNSPARPYAILTVGDSGSGIQDEIMGRIFEPFFTTKAVDKGTGLGLSIVHGLVERLGGRIEVSSEVGVGTKFKVSLPVLEDVHFVDAIKPDQISKGERQHILLVDDEEPLLRAMGSMLDILGYRTTAVTDPQEALNLISADGRDFDLIISDQTMPGLNGIDLVREVQARKTHIPAILITGHRDDRVLRLAEQIGIKEVIGKPITMVSLSAAMESALNSREPD